MTRAVPQPSETPSFWATVREAVRGTEQELTSVPIKRAVLLLAVPMVLEMSMESLFAIVDIFFVSRLGSDAVATVGLTESMLSLIYALAMGLSAGATALVSRKAGAKDLDGAATAAGQVILVALACATVLGIVGVALSSHLLGAMGAAPSVVATGSGYTAIMLGGSVTIFLLFVVNAIFRSAGDAAVAMRSLWLANGLNIALAPCFIFGLGPFPRMGVAGAAVATTLSRGAGVGYQLLALRRGRGRLVLRPHHLKPRPQIIRELLKLSGAASLQVLIETASWLGLVRILSAYGSIALAGYTIAMRVAIFALLPSWGLANAAATLVGQNLGAGEPERAKRSVTTIARYNVVFLGVVGLLFALAPHLVVSPFTTDALVEAYGSDCLRIVALGFVVFAYGMVMVQAFNGAGDTVTPMLVNLACFWFFKIPIAYVLANGLGLGPRGVFISITAAYAVQAVVSSTLFRRGRWQTKQIG
ncbi:MAG: MATE family efflux transporter [Myxococcales bacterium 68-20]|nr:MAG: MATE family efflux transporter [Myxococcales bacterium 68-20]